MKKKGITIILGIVVCTIGILTFIFRSNDHIECSSETKHTIGENGEKISTTTHLCKEKYSF